MEENKRIEQLEEEVNYLKKNNKSFFKSTIIGMIVVGALGSGLWSNICTPIFEFLSAQLSDIIPLISKNMMNGTYVKVSKGLHEDYSLQMYMGFMVILMSAYLILWKRISLEDTIQNADTSKIRNSLRSFFNSKKFVLFMTVFAWIFCIFSIGESIYINSTITQTLNNIEIVSPYINDEEYKYLKSKFYSIKGTSDYDKLVEELNAIAKENNIILKDK